MIDRKERVNEGVVKRELVDWETCDNGWKFLHMDLILMYKK